MPGSPPTLPGTTAPRPAPGLGDAVSGGRGFGEMVKLFSKSSKLGVAPQRFARLSQAVQGGSR